MGPLLERRGDAGKTVIPLDVPVSTGPVVVEAEQPTAARLSVGAKARYELLGDPLLHTYDAGFAGRAWTFLRATRPSRLTVTAKGPWTVRIQPIEAAAAFDTTVERTGCDVVAYRGPATDAVVDYRKHVGFVDTDSIHVHMLPLGAVDRNAVEWLLVGDESGRHPIHLPGPCFLFVRTDGAWSITRTGAATATR